MSATVFDLDVETGIARYGNDERHGVADFDESAGRGRERPSPELDVEASHSGVSAERDDFLSEHPDAQCYAQRLVQVAFPEAPDATDRVPNFLNARLVLKNEYVFEVALSLCVEGVDELGTARIEPQGELEFGLVGVLRYVTTFRVTVVAFRVDDSVVGTVELEVDGHHVFGALDIDGVDVGRVFGFVVVWKLRGTVRAGDFAVSSFVVGALGGATVGRAGRNRFVTSCSGVVGLVFRGRSWVFGRRVTLFTEAGCLAWVPGGGSRVCGGRSWIAGSGVSGLWSCCGGRPGRVSRRRSWKTRVTVLWPDCCRARVTTGSCRESGCGVCVNYCARLGLGGEFGAARISWEYSVFLGVFGGAGFGGGEYGSFVERWLGARAWVWVAGEYLFASGRN